MIDISQILFEELSANLSTDVSADVSSDVSSDVSAVSAISSDINQDELRKIASDTFAQFSTTDYKLFAKKTDTAPCKMSLLNIVAQLHVKASEKALGSSKDFIIINSAIEGTDLKSAKFYGPGKHILAVVQKKKTENGGMTPTEARKYLAEYVKWFVGPDITFTEKDMLPFSSNDDEATKHSKKTKVTKSDDFDDFDTVQESHDVISFSDFIKINEANENDNNTQSNEQTKTPTPDNDNLKKSADVRAEGWYISYRFLIEGVPEKPFIASAANFIASATKLGLKFLSGIGIQSFDWRSGSRGDTHTLGDMHMIDAIKMFGKINPDELLSSYEKKLREKLPKSSHDSRIIDTPTILKQKSVKSNIEPDDRKKIEKAKYALCTRVDKNDPSYKLYNQKLIAELVTSAIQGIYKKFKNKIYPEDVIFVNNYSDNTREKKKYNDTDRTVGSVADSIQQHNVLPMLNEVANSTTDNNTSVSDKTTTNNRNVEQIKNEIQAYVDNLLTNETFGKNTKFHIVKSDQIINTLKDNNITDEELNAYLLDHDYGYQLTIDGVNENIDIVSMLMVKLFEDTNVGANQTIDQKARIEKIFKNMFIKFKPYAIEKNVTSSPTVYEFSMREQVANESITTTLINSIKTKLSCMLNEATEIDNQMIKTLNAKLQAAILTAQTGGKPGIRPTTWSVFGNLATVKQYLDDKGLFNSTIFDDDDENLLYGAVVFKKPLDAKHSSDGKKHGATVGYNNVNKSVISDKFALSLGETVDEQMYTQTANDKFCYNKSTVPANCDVYVAKFKNEDIIKHFNKQQSDNIQKNSGDDKSKTDDTDHNNDENHNDESAANKQHRKIYVVVDVNGFLDAGLKDKSTSTNNKTQTNVAHTDYDFYIVPMKGLKYKDSTSASNGK